MERLNLIDMKEKLKKAGLWIKLHWTYLLAAVVAIGSLLFASTQYTDILNKLNVQAGKHKEELTKLARIQQENTERQARIEETYRSTLTRIEETRTSEIQKIDSAKKEQIRVIVEQTHDDPQEMARSINALLGYAIVLPSGA